MIPAMLSPLPATVSERTAAIRSLQTTFWEHSACLAKARVLVRKLSMTLEVSGHVSVSLLSTVPRLPLNSSAIVFSAQAFMMSLQT